MDFASPTPHHRIHFSHPERIDLLESWKASGDYDPAAGDDSVEPESVELISEKAVLR